MRKRKDNVTRLDDYRTTTKYGRAVKKQSRDRLMSRINSFLCTADEFFQKANSKKGKKLVEDLKDGDT